MLIYYYMKPKQDIRYCAANTLTLSPNYRSYYRMQAI